MVAVPERRGHRKIDHPLYQIWHGMKSRCLRKSDRRYPRYGGRDITVCPEWRTDFWSFADYVSMTIGDRPSLMHSIDRIDNDRGYEPGNIRWADRYEQARKREVTDKWRASQKARWSKP
jgi:hypothetical protein